MIPARASLKIDCRVPPGLAGAGRAGPSARRAGPQRHQTLLQSAPLIHSADERIDARDLGFAAGFYADVVRELLGAR